MKRLIFILFSGLFFANLQAQVGDLLAGANGGFITKYNTGMYGLNVSYHITDPLEASFTSLLNPKVSLTDEFDKSLVDKLSLYSFNLDLRYYMLHMRDWGTGPTLGYQLLVVKDKNKNASLGDFNASGLNLGWHVRVNLTDEIKIFGGWRYTMASENASHHLFNIGIGYTFSLF